jgi:hypothetical protein
MNGIGSHKLRSLNEIKEFVFAGRAIFTVVNIETGNRLTFKFSKPKDRKEDDAAPIFAGVLNGPGSYSFIGTIFDPHDDNKITFRHSHKSRIDTNSVSAKTVNWIVNRLKLNDIPATIEFWHEGHCGRCGKLLTVPESIENGLGPVCMKIRR